MICGLILASSGLAQADGSSDARAQEVAKLYNQGLVAEKNGQVDTAKVCYESVLALQPRHGNARFRLLNLKSRRAELSNALQKRKLQKIIIPNVEFSEVKLSEAIEGLSVLITNHDPQKQGVNLVLQDPKGLLSDKKINIKLKGVPASAILDYILAQGSATARYDAYAVTVKPLDSVQKRSQKQGNVAPKKESIPLTKPDSVFAN